MRDGDQHKFRAHEFAALQPGKEREDFFKEYGVRWYEFARLPYFDANRMTIIDPMHNLLMGTCIFLDAHDNSLIYHTGIMKNHWYNTWIQRKTLRGGTSKKKRELDLLHEYLKDVSICIKVKI